ncbi:TAFII55 protein conserved region-domain-containing protein [Peziza echinospora]|nr:TAFII55 protein conserved region-domain-containing protein [Peziza echinospora]
MGGIQHPPLSTPSKVSKSSHKSTLSSSTKLKPIVTSADALHQLTSNGNNNSNNSGGGTPITLKTPKLKLKANGARPKKRHFEPGLGYDSEASDREDDPAIEEQFILRMKPGPDCDYLRHVIEMKQLDQNTDVWMKFKDNRKAVVSVRGNLYSALLVDLPCIVESSKTLDKKAIFKTADICQMLLVGDRIPYEDAIHSIHHKPTDLIYPHGLTPPLQYVRKRRFRKRVSNRTIEAVETEVDRLLAADNEAESSRYELLDAMELMREESYEDGGGYDMLGQAGGESGMQGGGGGGGGGGAQDGYNDEDAEGEEEFEMDEDDLAMQMESALMGEGGDADAEGEVEEGDMLAALNGAGANAEESEEDDEDGDDEDAEGEMDEDAQESAQQNQKIREEIADLEAAYKAQLRELEKAQNPIIKARKQTALDKIINELEFKRNTLMGGGGI